MPVFKYRAITESGTIISNKVEDVSRKSLIKKLRRNNITPIDIQQVTNKIITTKKQRQKKNVKDVTDIMEGMSNADYISILNSKAKEKKSFAEIMGTNLNPKITNRDLVIFTQDLYLLKKANFNNIHALTTIVEMTENSQLREIVKDILAGVEAGENMYTTMEYYSEVFPYLYINMVRVGELSGSLTKSLEEAVQYLDETEKFNKKLRGILIPNALMLVGIIIMLFVGVIVIVPLIQNLFESMGSTEKLPAITLWFADAVKVILRFWFIPVAIIAGIIFAFWSYIHTPKGRYNFDYFKYRMPLFGKLIFSLDFLRFSRAMLLNLNNGIRIQDSLEVSKNVVKNYVLRSIIESSINDIILGQSWIESFEKSKLASPMIIEMLNIGMKTDLREMMGKLLEYMQVDIDNTIAKIMKVLPEIVYAIIGIALMFVVVVVLVPCIQAYMGGWLFSTVDL